MDNRKVKDTSEVVRQGQQCARPCDIYSQTGDVASCLSHLDHVLELAPELAEDAAQDEHLGWALKMKRIRDGQGPEDSREDAF